MKLPDGTKVSLGQFSTLRYPKVFNSNYREIYLEGEAYFEVTENLNQPFIVHALKTTTKVLGTSFDIRTYAHETVDELTVFTGKVKFGLDNFSTEEEVLPGTQAIFNRNSQRISKETIGLSNVLAWKDNSLVFEDASLQIVIADVGRFFNIKIRVEDTQLLKCRFRGSFRNPDLKNILDVIAYSLNLKYKLVNGSYVFEGKPCSTDK
jgi:ferric-dicitrate binding protein FerR (iron transport regulator)